MTARITQLRSPTDHDLADLAELLVDAVQGGAAVSFLAPLSHDVARDWWQRTFASLHPKAAVLIARDESEHIVGSVQLQPAWAPNQPHRADICKLLVHSRARRQGIARDLMQTAESHAKQSGITLLTLDAKRGAVAEHLYSAMGWTRVGVIPDYALDADAKQLHDTVIYFKRV